MIPKLIAEHYTFETYFAALKERLKSLVEIYDKNEFPFTGKMLGFGFISVMSKEECLFRILELSELTQANIQKIDEELIIMEE